MMILVSVKRLIDLFHPVRPFYPGCGYCLPALTGQIALNNRLFASAVCKIKKNRNRDQADGD